ncbi:MAG TPA: alpha/beta hydrolase [Ktedonobacteraceae bacterium]|nr:alpha/beta hydrolase [Ktedonobacteraceae bacterium]
MQTPSLLAGIRQHTITTPRLNMAYLEAGTGTVPIVLVHGNCSSSLFFQDLMLAVARSRRYTIYAPDLRGFGHSETLPVDATRGVRDFSEDLTAFVQTLHLPPFHLLGWSLGGNIVMQYAIDTAATLRSLTLEATGSPFGFGGTKGREGSLIWPDAAGSGAGTANATFVQCIALGDRSSEPLSPRTVMHSFYFKPPFRPAPDREESYLSGLLSTSVTPGNYPGDVMASKNWPSVAPGLQGVNNAISPKYLNQALFAHLFVKVPVLWIRGADDQIVSDTSLFDVGFLGQVGAVADWPGAQVYPPQPMIAQTRLVLDTYRSNGGDYSEVVLADCGHSPHIEKLAEFVACFSPFVDAL